MTTFSRFPVYTLFIAFVFASFAWAETNARFSGKIVTSFLSDGRNMLVEKDFSYTDPNGLIWKVPKGSKTDGASIPQVLWIQYPPFTGKYRAAAVLHDHYCQNKKRSWQETHNVFYDAMITAGVASRQAMLMQSAVYYFGPRWGENQGTRGPVPSASKQKDILKDLELWISLEKPSRQQIIDAIESGQLSN